MSHIASRLMLILLLLYRIIMHSHMMDLGITSLPYDRLPLKSFKPLKKLIIKERWKFHKHLLPQRSSTIACS